MYIYFQNPEAWYIRTTISNKNPAADDTHGTNLSSFSLDFSEVSFLYLVLCLNIL